MKFQPQTGVLQTCLSKNLTKVEKRELLSIKRQNTLKCEIILQFNSNDSHEYCLYFQYMYMASATLEGRVNAIHVLGIQKNGTNFSDVGALFVPALYCNRIEGFMVLLQITSLSPIDYQT